MSKNLIRQTLAVVGLAAVALAGAAGAASAAGAATHSGSGHSGRAVRAPFATRAQALRLARRLLGKAVLPPGVRPFDGKLPGSIGAPAERPASDHIVDAHAVLAVRRSMDRTFAFVAHHRPAGWLLYDTGQTGESLHGKDVVTEKYVTYSPRHLPAAFNLIHMLVQVAAGRHGHALIRVDVQVIWYPRRSAAEYLVARHFLAVRIDEWISYPKPHHQRRTFRQRAIIGKLTRILNALPASPGGVWSCPYGIDAYRLTFMPVKGRLGAIINAPGCPPLYGISVGGQSLPALADNGKIEQIADHLLRGSHRPAP